MRCAAVALAAVLVAGCGSSQDARVARLERRVAELEKEIVRLKSAGETSKADTPAAKPVAHHADWAAVPLEPGVEKGLQWLVSVQGADGGWGQDGGKDGDARSGVPMESSGNDVANTALVALALIRAGNTLTQGPYRESLRKTVDFILAHVEAAPAEGIDVTKRKGTQIQRKLGPHVDTFLATMVLAEADGAAGDAVVNRRVRASLDKCVAKIEKNQQKDGSWNVGDGWAPVLSTSMASRGLYRAQTKGVKVDAPTMEKAEKYQQSTFNSTNKSFDATEGAGVPLYTAGGGLEYATRNGRTRKENEAMIANIPKLLDDERFLGGFGSMGGEEFVSYMNISDSLLRLGGETWGKWNAKIKEHVLKLQNQDGTWAGHHCITGRVACTSSAVLTLLTERTGPKL